MKIIITNLLMFFAVALFAQSPQEEKGLTVEDDEVYSILDQIAPVKKPSPDQYQKDNQMFNNDYKAKPLDSDLSLEAVKEKVFFPEGFTMELNRNEYIISKEKGKYMFRYKNTPNEHANFEIFITENNIQEALADNNYFLISKNDKLAMYAVCAVNEETNRRKIVGFRLFYTINIGKGMFVTNRSDIFKDYRAYAEYVTDVVNIDPCYNIAYNNVEK